MRIARICTTAALLMLVAPPALALDWSYMVGVGGIHTGNAFRQPQDELDESITSAEIGLYAERDSDDIDFDFAGRFRYLAYDKNLFDDELLSLVSANGSFRISPAVRWLVQENFGQIVQDPLEVVTPENREDINSLATGPEFTFDLGAGNAITASILFSDLYYEISNNDNNRVSLITSWGRQSTSTRYYSVNAEAEQIRYDDAGLTADFDRFRFYGSIQNEIAGSTFMLDIGLDKVELKDDIPVVDDLGTLVRLSLRRDLDERSRVELRGASEFTDGGDRFASDSQQFSQFSRPGNAGGGDPTSVIASNNFFQFSELALSLYRSGQSARGGFTVFWRDEDYAEDFSAPRDRTEQGADVYLTIPFGSRRQLDVYGSKSRTEYLIQKVVYDDYNAGMFFRQDLGRNFSIRMQMDYVDRDGSDPTRSYSELRGSLNVYFGKALDRFAYLQ